MKKIICNLLVIASALAATACARQLDGDTTSPANSIRATISDDVYITKTIVIDNPGKRVDSYWADGDKMGIFGAGGSNVEFSIAPGDISEDRKSANFRSETAVPKGQISAYVPYSASATISGDELMLEMPAVQHPVFANGTIQPDPASNIMVAVGSKEAGLTFHNVLSILKVGQLFDTGVRLARVEFRDLDSKPVCGAMRIRTGDAPSAEITGSGSVITLDLGSGLTIPVGTVQPLYLYVPARQYPKGFEITFVTTDGTRTVRTAGRSLGKTLERSVIYTIGDITALDYIPGATATLADDVTLMTQEKLDMVDILYTRSSVLRDKDGAVCYDQKGRTMYMPEFDMLVHKDLAPEVGKEMLFEGGVEDLPCGGLYRITECSSYNGEYFRVKASADPDIAKAYKEVTAGTPLFDDEGNWLEGGGIDVDIAGNIKSILDERGNEVPFSIDADGNIEISESDLAEVLGVATEAVPGPATMVEAPTKGAVSTTYTMPKLSINVKRPHGEAALGAQMTIDTKFAIGVIAGEFQYVHTTFSPKFTMSADFTLKAEFSITHDMRLFTIDVVPIAIAPGLFLCPTIYFNATVGVGGDIKFTASVKYVYDMGMYGFSYNKGAGFTFRHQIAEPSKDDGFHPELGGLSGSLSAFGTLSIMPYMSLSGLFGAGVDCATTIKFSSTWTSTGTKLALTPELEFTPSTATLGGLYSKRWENLTTKIEFNPIWEMDLSPQVTVSQSPFREELTDRRYIVPLEYFDPPHLLDAYWPCGLELSYQVTLREKYFMYLQFVLDIYEGEIHYYPYEWPDMNSSFAIHRFDVCQAAGIPHTSYSILGLDNPRRVSREIIGAFPSGDVGTLSGKRTLFSSGVGHGYTISVIYPDGTEEVLSGGNGFSNVQLTPDSPRKWMEIPGSMYHPAIYYWPHRANGDRYYTEYHLD